MQWFFEPRQVERLELLRPADGGGGVPAQTGIDHQLGVRPDALPGRPHMGDVARLALTHRTPAELDGPKALLHQPGADALGLGRRVAEQDGGVGAERLAETAAEELVDRPFRRLADDVPQGDLDAAHRLDDRPLPAEEDRALVHAVDEAVDLERVLADDALGQAAAYLVRQRRLDDRLGDERRRVGLADAGDAGVGMDLDDQRLLAAVAALVDIGQTQMDRLNTGDFHKRVTAASVLIWPNDPTELGYKPTGDCSNLTCKSFPHRGSKDQIRPVLRKDQMRPLLFVGVSSLLLSTVCITLRAILDLPVVGPVHAPCLSDLSGNRGAGGSKFARGGALSFLWLKFPVEYVCDSSLAAAGRPAPAGPIRVARSGRRRLLRYRVQGPRPRTGSYRRHQGTARGYPVQQ